MFQGTMVEVCMKEAVATAVEEAKANPIAIGEFVGHTDFETFGVDSGKLTAYDGDEAIVALDPGKTVRWKTEGMVNINRILVLTTQYLKRLRKVVSIVNLMDALGVPPQQTLSALLKTKAGPTPGCDCEYCMKFSQEERDAAVAGTQEEKTVSAGAGGSQEFDDLMTQLRDASSKFSTN